MDLQPKDAWIELPSDDVVHASMPTDRIHPYDFGIVMGMSRLSRVHPTIGPAFRELYSKVMFEEGYLERWEREMVAAVAAAAQDCQY
jgi:hypothetical protein